MKSGSTDGFTLIEMLAALTIAAIAMAVIAGNPFGRERPDTPGSLARKIAVSAAALEAEVLAKAKSQNITVDIAARTVTIGPARIEVPQDYAISLKTGAELIAQDERGSILLFPDGTSSGGEIAISDPSGKRATVRINWVTGAVDFDGDAP